MKIINVKDYKIGYSDQFYIDTNIWVLLYGNITHYNSKDKLEYTRFLGDIISKDKPIYITSMIVSEFANVFLRKEFKLWKDIEKKYSADFKKDFVGSERYKEAISSIISEINNILNIPNIQPISDSFHTINMENILKNFFLADFNDAYFYELALLNNYKIITNDRDFQKYNSKVTLITTQT